VASDLEGDLYFRAFYGADKFTFADLCGLTGRKVLAFTVAGGVLEDRGNGFFVKLRRTRNGFSDIA
jgi:hypothetical protein